MNLAMEEQRNYVEMTHEQLVEECSKLSRRFEMVMDKLRQVNATNAIQRLSFLFKVLEFYAHFDAGFVTKCAEEIQFILDVEDTEQTETSHDA